MFVDLLRGPGADAALLVPPGELELTGADSVGLGSTLWGSVVWGTGWNHSSSDE